MAPSQTLTGRATRILGDLGTVADRVRDGLPAEDRTETRESWPGPVGDAASDGAGVRTADAAPDPARERTALLRAGAFGLAKLAAGNEAELEPLERIGVEAIVLLEGRPAITVRDGDFPTQDGPWAVLEQHRAAIGQSITRVGRMEVAGHPDLDWVGTAFLVSPDVLMTNRHVAVEFARRNGITWQFRPGRTARWDRNEEQGSQRADEFRVTEVLGIHDDDDIDLALLRVEQLGDSGLALPDPVAFFDSDPGELDGRQVYVVGYPARDGRRNEPAAMRRIFADLYDVKRLQPGEATGLGPGGRVLGHDCSTLGGNSGSPVFDLASHAVLGLHFGGRFGVGNHAVPLWMLRDDPLVAAVLSGRVGAGGQWSPDHPAPQPAPESDGHAPPTDRSVTADTGGPTTPTVRRAGPADADRSATGAGTGAFGSLKTEVVDTYAAVSARAARSQAEGIAELAVPVPQVTVSGSQPAWLPESDRRRYAVFCAVLAGVGVVVSAAAVVLDALVADVPAASWTAGFAALVTVAALVVGYVTVAGFGQVELSVSGGGGGGGGAGGSGAGGSGAGGSGPGSAAAGSDRADGPGASGGRRGGSGSSGGARDRAG